MKKRLSKEKLKLYQSLQKMKPDVLSEIMQHLDDNSINDLCECVYNVIHTDLSLSPKVKQRLRNHLKKNVQKKTYG